MTASNYDAIREENVGLYGTRIDKYGPVLLSHQYADRSHFIYELLQNAEDALARRQAWSGSRAVAFALTGTQLRVSHYGTPFTNADVQGICGIAMTTKDITSIGRFGIGFKSVYAFTDRPEVHSGDEHFAIESYVWPTSIGAAAAQPEETVFVFPFRDSDTAAHEDVSSGLQKLEVRTLLFLRQIDEISWSVEGGSHGVYLRSPPEEIGEGVRRVTLLGEEEGKADTEETWTVFSREVTTERDEIAGHVEIAFSMAKPDESGHRSIQAVSDSPLVVSFPTVLPTYLGFLVQGPYRTTPSRDNVPVDDPWNRHLVQETAVLLVEALRWLRDHELLDTAVLECLPLDPLRFTEDRMFGPLFEAVRSASLAEPLLPCFGGGYVAASQAKIARTQELRELFNPYQLGVLYGAEGEFHWLSGDISQDRTPDLREYLMRQLDIDEATPDVIVSKLDKVFLGDQSDDWIRSLYEFLNGQTALLKQGKLTGLPLIRLEDGIHVAAGLHDGQPTAFLPSDSDTGFPTVRRAVCVTDKAVEFLASLGLAQADPVDVVIAKVLPRFANASADVTDGQYEADIRQILAAWHTDSTRQKEKLTEALRKRCFVRVTGTGGGVSWAEPDGAYLATNLMKDLFSGVPGVLVVDDSRVLLRQPEVIELLEQCGASRCLRPIRFDAQFRDDERESMRRKAGYPGNARKETIQDWRLEGLDQLLALLPSLNPGAAIERARLLWTALCEAEQQGRLRGTEGKYDWLHYWWRSYEFDPSYCRQLSSSAWVPATDGQLEQPSHVPFGATGWHENAFLLSKIPFMLPVIETPTEEAGIADLVEHLKQMGVTTWAQLGSMLGIKDQPDAAGAGAVHAALEKLLGGVPLPAPLEPGLSGGELLEPSGAGTAGPARPHVDLAAGGQANSRTEDSGQGGGKRTPGGTGGRPFISYVGVQPDEEADPDGLDQQTRIALEEKAITLIVDAEPGLHRTPVDNPGYDLFEAAEEGHMVRWVEVKAMAGDLHGRPVGLSRTQFEWAREHGGAYWLYIVERADSPQTARVVRIQDPAGKARTFTFDHGWLSVAQLSDSTLPDERKQSEEG